ncbi:MAG: DnaD domain protein [Erysipelotrichaceae bacterium]|nr:DnaD domain protein [Erysipelotrichaceae bacterium]
MSLHATDDYFSQYSYPLDEVQNDTLIYLYMPLIGKDAYALYMFLYNEGKRMNHYHYPSPISRITSYLNCDLETLDEAIKVLAAVGLIQYYSRLRKERTTYLYQVCSPLSLKNFFKNQILTTLLKQTIGTSSYDRTRRYFQIKSESLKNYEEHPVKFTDVFDVDLKQERPLRTRAKMYEEVNQGISIDYDTTLFEESLRDHHIPLRMLGQSIDQIIQLGYVYAIDPLTLASLVRDCFNDDHIDMKLFEDRVKSQHALDSVALNDVYLKQSEADKSQTNGQSTLDKHLRYLESISPYELLKSRQGGKEPIMRDLAIVETLMVQLGLTPAVTNVLIEYVLAKNDNRLPKSYIETIGASWARKHLKTARDAYECAKGFDNGEPVEKAKEKPVKQNEESNEALMAMISQMKGDQHD